MPEELQNDESLTLKTLDAKSFKPPESRVGKPSAIRSRVTEMRIKDRTRSFRRTNIQREIDGKRPFNQAKLESLGQGNRTNFNLREGEGMADAAKTPYYSLVTRNPRYCHIQCDYGDQMQRRAEWSDSMSASFHTMLEDWEEHDFNLQLRDWQMCVFGVGIPMFTDEESPFWESRKIGEVLVPYRTLANVKKVPECAVTRRINPVDLYKLVEKESSAKAMGWFPDRVKTAIVKIAPQSLHSSPGFGDMWGEEYQASLRRGDVTWNALTSEIPIYDYFVKEFDGRITHCILLDDGSPASPTNDEDDGGLLFKKVGRYESFSQILQPFFFDVGTGEWHSIKGLGPKILDFCQVSNRTFCGIVDGARTGSALLLQATDANAMEQTQLIEIAGANVVQPGFSVQQNRIAESLEGPMGMRRELLNTCNANIGQYRINRPGDLQAPTLGQEQLNYQKESSLNESAVDRFCKTYDRLYKEQVRRALTLGMRIWKKRNPNSTTPPEDYVEGTEAEELCYWFIQRCIERGVPEQALDFDYICSVKATRGVGSGSPVGMDMATQGLLSLIPMMDERGRRNTLRMRAAFLVGQGNVDAIFPPFDEADLPNDHAALATLENNALHLADGETLITPRQDHVIHFKVHFQDAAQHVQQVKGGQGNPMALLIHLHQAGPHMKAHISNLAGDKTRELQFKQFEEAWLALSKVADQLQQQIEESMKNQQPPQPKVDPALAAALAKVQGDLEIKRIKTAGDLQLKTQKQEAMLRLKDLQTAHDMRLQKLELMNKPVEQPAAAA